MASHGFTSKVLKGLSGKKRPPLEPFYIYLFILLLSYATADLVILKFRPEMLPSEPPPTRPEKRQQLRKPLSNYYAIQDRNIFNADGEIPPPLSAQKEEKKLDAPAVKSNLPLQLMGTIVHVNPARSVASILVKNAGTVNPYMVDDEIERMATITAIERQKVTFRNSANGRLEFIEIPKNFKLNFGIAATKAAPTPSGNDLVRVLGPNKYGIKRSDIDGALQDLPNLLKEARMVPNKTPGGQIEGFVFKWIKPGSVIEQLGYKVGDVITGVNGEPINSTRKALEAFNTLRDSRSDLEVNMLRSGKKDKVEYSID